MKSGEYSYIAFSLILLNQVPSLKGDNDAVSKECSLPLGMKSGAIKDVQIRGRGREDGTKHSDARLDGPKSWCAVMGKTLRSSTQIEIDLGAEHRITSIAFQAGNNQHSIMKMFFLRYRKRLDEQWITYRQGGKVKVISAEENKKKEPFIARYLVLFPFSSRREVACVRMEFYGCVYVEPTLPPTLPPGDCSAIIKPRNGIMIGNMFHDGAKVEFKCNEKFAINGSSETVCKKGQWTEKPPICQACPVKLGMESGEIEDSQITGEGSYYGSKQSNARLHGQFEWCAVMEKTYEEHTYIQIDLRKPYSINKFVFQGGIIEAKMKVFRLLYKSRYDDPWKEYHEGGKVKFVIDNDPTLREPITTRYIQLYPFSDRRQIGCMRMEMYGCPLSDCPPCVPSVGVKTACSPDNSPYDYGVVLEDVSLEFDQGSRTIRGQVRKIVFSKVKYLLREGYYYRFNIQTSVDEHCACPVVEPRKSYLLFGKIATKHFLLDSTSIVEEWSGIKIKRRVRKRCKYEL